MPIRLTFVVPTRNRPDLAIEAVQSVLATDDPRVAVMVSDNSTDTEARAELMAACSRIGDPRLSYVAPPRPMPMTAHWEWALNEVRVDPATTHVGFVTDRMLLRPGAFPYLMATIVDHPEQVISYGYSTIVDLNEPVSLVRPDWTGRLLEVPASHVVRLFARGDFHEILPRLMNNVVPRGVLDHLEGRHGTIVTSAAPDHTFAFRCLDEIPSILFLDRHLLVQRALDRSNGYSQARAVRTRDHSDFVGGLRGHSWCEHAPTPEIETISNAVFSEYEVVRRLSTSGRFKPLRRRHVLAALERDLGIIEDRELVARSRKQLRARGWNPVSRAINRVAIFTNRLRFYGRHPRLFLHLRKESEAERWVTSFATSSEAVAFALEHDATPFGTSKAIRPLLVGSGARDLPVPDPGASGSAAAPASPAAPPRERAAQSVPVRSSLLTKACELEDFRDGVVRSTIREVFAHDVETHGPQWPTGHEYRKHWEVAMAIRALRECGALHSGADVLGVGAGNEPTLFWLTNHVHRVFATDLYLGDEWDESAAPAMLTDPGRFWPTSWDPRRLVVQQMDGRELLHPDASFDAVFSSSSIEHFGDHEDVGRAIDEAYRVLKPGGVLSLSTEMRLAGEGPGLPGVLLFTPQQLNDLVVQRRPWTVVNDLDASLSAATMAAELPFANAAADVQAHVAEHGAIYFDRLQWSQHPHIVLRHGDYVWTSVHLALRKPD